MIIVLKDDKVIATHRDDQNISLELYPSADAIEYVPDSTQIDLIAGTYVLPADSEAVKTHKKLKVDEETKQTIYKGIVYSGVRFYLTAENQRNFAELDRLRDDSAISYPYTVWSGSDSVQIQDSAEMHAFYLQGMLHIQTTLLEGKTQKDLIDQEGE